MTMVILGGIAFLGTHFLLSHPLRAPLVVRVGEQAFLGLYSLVALLTFGWLVLAYRAAPMTPMLWPVGDLLWGIVTAAMLVASILFVGSLIGNPALPGPGKPAPVAARGVYAITRHPMMWAFAIWGLCHVAVYPIAANIVLAAVVVVLALVGARLQDHKKARLQPDMWPGWERRTSYWPFAAIIDGRARLGGFRAHDIGGGVIVWLAATWAHIPLAGWAAGIWRWL